MSDRDMLERAFADFSETPSVWIRPPGVADARRRARDRRRHRIAGLAVVAALTAAVPLALNTAVPGPAPATTPTVTPNPPVITTTAKPGPGVLRDATADLDWSWTQRCQSGPTTFRDGVATSGDASVEVLSVAHTDVDRDGRAEVVAAMLCDVANGAGPVQVVGLQPTGPGAYRVFGTVLRTEPAVDGEIGVRTLATGDNGQVNVEVVDRPICCGRPEETANRQWRTFAWTGSGFEQVSGQRSFDPPANSKVAVQVTNVALGAPVPSGDPRPVTGTGRLVVINDGPRALTIVTAVFWIYNGYGGATDVCDRQVCRLEGLPVGTRTELDFRLEVNGPFQSGTTVTVGEVALFADLLTYARVPITVTVP
jgi:hypothetical protein